MKQGKSCSAFQYDTTGYSLAIAGREIVASEIINGMDSFIGHIWQTAYLKCTMFDVVTGKGILIFNQTSSSTKMILVN
jgi:hypothetical protein